MRLSDYEGNVYHDARHLVPLIANRTDCCIELLWRGEQISAALSFETTKRLETAAYVQFQPEATPDSKDRIISILRRYEIDHVWEYVYPRATLGLPISS